VQAALYVVLGSTGRRRSVVLVSCPLCEEVHEHTAVPSFVSGRRRAACRLGYYVITVRGAS
jgi:hypothetical protein